MAVTQEKNQTQTKNRFFKILLKIVFGYALSLGIAIFFFSLAVYGALSYYGIDWGFFTTSGDKTPFNFILMYGSATLAIIFPIFIWYLIAIKSLGSKISRRIKILLLLLHLTIPLHIQAGRLIYDELRPIIDDYKKTNKSLDTWVEKNTLIKVETEYAEKPEILKKVEL